MSLIWCISYIPVYVLPYIITTQVVVYVLIKSHPSVITSSARACIRANNHDIIDVNSTIKGA